MHNRYHSSLRLSQEGRSEIHHRLQHLSLLHLSINSQLHPLLFRLQHSEPQSRQDSRGRRFDRIRKDGNGRLEPGVQVFIVMRIVERLSDRGFGEVGVVTRD